MEDTDQISMEVSAAMHITKMSLLITIRMSKSKIVKKWKSIRIQSREEQTDRLR